MKKLLLASILIGTSLNAFAWGTPSCEKWKSEYLKLGQKVAAYGVTFEKYSTGKYSEEKFLEKKKRHFGDMTKLDDYVDKTKSCEGMDARKTRLQAWIQKTKEAIRNNSDQATEMAKEIRDDFF